MAFNFNNDPETLTVDGRNQGDNPPAAPADAPATPKETPTATPQSAAFTKFRSCRWHQPKEDGNAEFCTHREVKPYAGTSGFDADAWCPDCQYYKLRRSPKKRQPGDQYTY